MSRAILTYHSIDESASVVSTRTISLERQMARLAASGVSATDPPSLVETPRDGCEIALTFDDGFENFYTEAYPILARQGFSATVLLAAGLCGGKADWAGQPASLLDRELLSWSKIEELQRSGIRFGAHSMTHADLTSLSMDAARAEILDSKRMIEDRTGAAVDCFAYPYGKFSQPVADVVAENFPVGLSTRMGFVGSGSRREALERIDAYYLRSPFWFDRLFESSGRAYVACRAAARRIKGRLSD